VVDVLRNLVLFRMVPYYSLPYRTVHTDAIGASYVQLVKRGEQNSAFLFVERRTIEHESGMGTASGQMINIPRQRTCKFLFLVILFLSIVVYSSRE
jgi:hypothetical protein